MSYKKVKGKSFENQIAQIIHNKFYELDKDYKEIFESLNNISLAPVRDFASGNFKNSDGDINLNLLKEKFPFSIECKFHKNLNLSIDSIFKEKINKIIKIFENQAKKKANEVNLIPLVVFKANYTEIFCLFEYEDFNVDFIHKFDKLIKYHQYAITLFDDFITNWIERRK